MTTASPRVSVIMGVYNGDDYLAEAMESVLGQTLVDFELLAIDDGSVDGSWPVLETFAARDRRVVLVRHHGNLGLTRTLNEGLSMARGEYIARLDADDVAFPERLARQVSFMDCHAEVGVSGTWARETGSNVVREMPTEDGPIRCGMLFSNTLLHPTVILRRDLLVRTNAHYDPSYRQAQDYDLWTRLTPHTRFANLPQILVQQRIHPDQISALHAVPQETYADQVRLRQLRQLALEPNAQELRLHSLLAHGLVEPTQEFTANCETWLQKLHRANEAARLYPEPDFSDLLGHHWFLVCRSQVSSGWRAWRTYWQSSLSQRHRLRTTTQVKFALLCAMYGMRRRVRAGHRP